MQNPRENFRLTGRSGDSQKVVGLGFVTYKKRLLTLVFDVLKCRKFRQIIRCKTLAGAHGCIPYACTLRCVSCEYTRVGFCRFLR